MALVPLCFIFLCSLAFGASENFTGSKCKEGEFVSKIELSGLKHTRERVVWRELQHKIGSLYLEQLDKENFILSTGLNKKFT